MISPFYYGFQAFVNSRLDRVGQSLKDSSEYQTEQSNIEQHTRELQAVLSPQQAITLQDIDDSNLKLLKIYEYNCYWRGFKDALRLMCEE